MKLTSFLITLSFVQVSATTFAQKITLKEKNAPLETIFKKISQQSNHNFIYTRNTIKDIKPISIEVKSMYLNDVLDKIFIDQYIEYTIDDKSIIVSKKQNFVTPKHQMQKKTVTGQVLDNNGKAIVTATIKEKGTNHGTVTDNEGKFQLKVSEEGATLIFSYLGYSAQEITANFQSPMIVTLDRSINSLDEIVIVGYGTQKKTDLTGSIETIKVDQIENKPVTSLAQALTGEAAGVTVVQRSSKPGAYDEFIRIRGVGTWGNSNPLILVDGVELSMDKVNPNDVQTVTVLKDAAAAAIYGSRAGNGVILITTKRASLNGKSVVNYTNNLGIQVPTRMPHFFSTYEFYEMKNRGAIAEGKSPLKTEEQMNKFRNNQWNPDANEANTNWLDEIVHNGFQQNHNLSLNSGNDKIGYMLSIGYLDQNSVVGENTAFNRYNARLNSTTILNKWLKIDANLSYIRGQATEPVSGVTTMIRSALESDPARPIKYSDGTWALPGAAPNAVRMGTTNDFGNSATITDAINGMISPEIKFLNGFKFKSVMAFDKNITQNDAFTKTLLYDGFTALNNPVPSQNPTVAVARNKKSVNWSQNFNLSYNATLDYEKSIQDHYFKILIGASRESFDYEFTRSSQSDLPSNEIDAIGSGTNLAQITGNRLQSYVASYFSRLNYAYKGKYLAEISVRRDGSSKFKQEYQWGTFPSYSLAWKVSDEKFFSILSPYVNNFKIRASYGHLGNNRIDDYKYLSTIKVDNELGYSFGDNIISNAYYEATMGNSIITWENLRSKNLGLDISMFKNRLNLTIDVYERKTTDILLDLPAPGTLGIDPPTTNAGVVSNKGWELTADWRDKIGNLNYNIGFNLSDVSNKILDMKGLVPDRTNLTIRRVGDPIDAIYGWVADGLALTQKQVDQHSKTMIPFVGGSTDPNATDVQKRFGLGDVIIKDINGDGKIDVNDKQIIGNQIPRYTFGINMGFNYKNLDVNWLLQGVGKVDGYLTYEATKPLFTPENSYNPALPNAGATMPRTLATWEYNWVNYTSFWVENAAYIRLKNLQIGYTCTTFQKLGLSKVKFLLTGENMFTYTKYRGWDPESSVGMRGYTYPLTAVYSFGLNATF